VQLIGVQETLHRGIIVCRERVVGALDSTTAELRVRRIAGLKTGIILVIVIVVLRWVPLTSGLFFFSIPERFCYDLVFQCRAPDPPPDIVIIEIDDYSLHPDRLGRFQSWSRQPYADLLAKLNGAEVVAFDVLFTEPDPREPEADEAFADAIRRHGSVVLGCYKEAMHEYRGQQEAGMASFAYPLQDGPGPLRPIQPLNFAPPIQIFAAAAAGVGYVDIEPDSDGVYRRVLPLRVGYDRRIYPHFATEIARVAAGWQPQDISAARGWMFAGPRALPLNPKGELLINYNGPTGTITRCRIWDVLEGNNNITPETFTGKIVLVGATAPGLYDIRNAPYAKDSRKFFGVETNANIVDSLLRRPPLRDDTGRFVWLLVAALMGTLAVVSIWNAEEKVGVSISLLIAIALALPSFFVLFILWQIVTPYGATLLAVGVPVAWGLQGRLRAERQMIRRNFEVYVSPDVLKELMADPEVIWRGQRREVTLLFSDVRGSTSLSENIPAEVWLAQLNEYLTQMSAAIFDYEGYLDKFMGDGVMVVWNVFGTQPDHAAQAVRCGQQMLKRLELLNNYWEQAPERTPFRIGIGIHTGEAVVGNVGSEARTQYTVIGDVVNTASRIEAMNKTLGTVFIVSEATAAKVEDRFVLKDIGEIEVRGRSEGIRIFEVSDEQTLDQKGGDSIAWQETNEADD